jgi:hypothetical protein
VTTPASPTEVNAANLAGRVHPSQRGQVLDGVFWISLVVGILMAALVIILPLATGILSGPNAGESYAALPFGVLLAVACLGLCWRRYRDLHRPLTVISGWTHDFGNGRLTDEYPIGMRFQPQAYKSVERREVRAGGRTYQLTPQMWALLHADRNNTLCLLPRTKVLVNVIPS